MSPFGREAWAGSDGRRFLEISSEERKRSHLVRACVEARLGQWEASERYVLGVGVGESVVHIIMNDAP